MSIRVANAPVSWGITESIAFPAEYPYSRVLDEIAEAGYAGTELGTYGFLPSDPAVLRSELARRNLTLCSAFVAFPLGNSAAHSTGFAHVDRTADLISMAGARLLILSDEVCSERSAVAGRTEEADQHSWNEAEWNAAIQAIREVARRGERFGLKVAFHHHAGTHVETPAEIDQLLSSLSPEELGLCLDTGHYAYGGGNPLSALDRYASRLRCVHLKDMDARRAEAARRQKLNFHGAVRSGVFAPLGTGSIDFRRVLGLLEQHRFDGWAVVEQDVLAGGEGAASPLANAVAARQFLRKLGY